MGVDMSLNNLLCGSSILLTGGTGSFGKAFVREIYKRCPNLKRLVVYSRDELKQYEMAQEFPRELFPSLRFFLGDVRDADRLRRALEGIDTVVHAAALKQVPAAEYNPFEFIKTNVLGAQNLIEACLDLKVKRVVALSTDKAAAPINLYGATKLCSDKLFVAANNYRGERDVRFSVVRYGNVMGSRGSVIPFFLDKVKTGTLPVTHPDMTRFNITLSEGVDMVMWAIENALGSEILVPKIPSYRILDVAEAVAPSARVEVVGIRPGEKLHEEMITASDGALTLDIQKYYVILPNAGSTRERYLAKSDCIPVLDGFSYNSGTNPDFLSVEQIRELVDKHVSTPLTR
jgi:UDP-N-acetylglucosamine 4,6-dehydratase/5-epimerase